MSATPPAGLIAIAKALQRQIDQPGYDLSTITVNAWAEALRNPDMHKQAYRFYNETHKTLAKFRSCGSPRGWSAPMPMPTPSRSLTCSSR
jgi:hypothetical protein